LGFIICFRSGELTKARAGGFRKLFFLENQSEMNANGEDGRCKVPPMLMGEWLH